MLKPGLLACALLLTAVLSSCGQSDGSSTLDGEMIADGDGQTPEVKFQRLSQGGGLTGVSALTSFACRDDAFFVSVRAGQSSGIHKLSLEAPESGWTYIYPQEAFLETTADRLIAAFPPGES